MVKAKDFMNHLCNELDYRFFSGVPVKGMQGIFKNMSADFMHYVPAANERIAASLATGVAFTGVKSVVLMSHYQAFYLDHAINWAYRAPLMILTVADNRNLLREHDHVVKLTDNYISCLDTLDEWITKSAGQVGTLYFKEDQIV